MCKGFVYFTYTKTLTMKNKILTILKEGELPTSGIAKILNESYYKTLIALRELQFENKIKMRGQCFKYWSLI
jgi:hypothetical protein